MKIRFSTRTFAASAAMLVASGCTVYEPAPSQGSTVYASAPEADEAAPDDVVVVQSVDDFDEPLASYGVWLMVGSYGRCWRPSHVDRDWRPYSNGQWVHADSGWYWQSNEPWGWATCHYGRWVDDADDGWIWVPDTQWAPSWVEWRTGGGYVGWAPLPPTRVANGRRHEDRDRDFVFVPEQHFVEPVRPDKVIVNNTTVIKQTVNISNVNVVNNNTTVINQGPRVQEIEKATGRKISTTPTAKVRREQEAPVVRAHPTLVRHQKPETIRPPARERAEPRPTAEPVRRQAEPQAPAAVSGHPNYQPAPVQPSVRTPQTPPAESLTKKRTEVPRRVETQPAVKQPNQEREREIEKEREQKKENTPPTQLPRREIAPPSGAANSERTQPSETHVRVTPPSRSEGAANTGQPPSHIERERPTTIEKNLRAQEKTRPEQSEKEKKPKKENGKEKDDGKSTPSP